MPNFMQMIMQMIGGGQAGMGFAGGNPGFQEQRGQQSPQINQFMQAIQQLVQRGGGGGGSGTAPATRAIPNMGAQQRTTVPGVQQQGGGMGINLQPPGTNYGSQVQGLLGGIAPSTMVGGPAFQGRTSTGMRAY